MGKAAEGVLSSISKRGKDKGSGRLAAVAAKGATGSKASGEAAAHSGGGAGGAGGAKGAGKKLKQEDLATALARLVISHDESLRELEASHHMVLLLGDESRLATSLKTTGEQYHQMVKSIGPNHTLGPPMGYLFMGILQTMVPLVEDIADGPEIVEGRTKKQIVVFLNKLEQDLSTAFTHDGDEVVGCAAELIHKYVPTCRSRNAKDGGRLLYFKLQNMEDTLLFAKIVEHLDDATIKWGKAPRGALVRTIQQHVTATAPK